MARGYVLHAYTDDGEVGTGGRAVVIRRHRTRREALEAAVAISEGTYWLDEGPCRVRIDWQGRRHHDWWVKDGRVYRTEPKLWGYSS